MKENERYLEYFQIPLIFCYRTPYGSYPMLVVFILSYWKLPFAAVFTALHTKHATMTSMVAF